ncbi:MAG: ABC transporter permease [Eubacteriales bacterium]
MFSHIFIYRLKCLIRDRQMIFWTLLFPLILATFFHLAFSNLTANEKFNPIHIAVVNNTAYQENSDFKALLENVSKGEEQIFYLTETSEDHGQKLLMEGSIEGVITLTPDIELMIRETGINESIIKIFLEQYQQTYDAAAKIIGINAQNTQEIINDISNRQEYTHEISLSDVEPNIILNYFYSLIAMACLYGAFWGLREIVDIQADQSTRAARINMSPVHKLKAFLFSMFAALLLFFIELLILLGYLYFVLGIDFGTKVGYVLLTTFIGSIVGLTFGAFISAVVKRSEGIKIAILIGVTMLGSFLSGMMFDQMKYIVAQKVPLLSYINPVNLLTDAYYSLYYYDTFSRYWWNIQLLGIFILLFSMGTYLILRRQKYASL